MKLPGSPRDYSHPYVQTGLKQFEQLGREVSYIAGPTSAKQRRMIQRLLRVQLGSRNVQVRRVGRLRNKGIAIISDDELSAEQLEHAYEVSVLYLLQERLKKLQRK